MAASSQCHRKLGQFFGRNKLAAIYSDSIPKLSDLGPDATLLARVQLLGNDLFVEGLNQLLLGAVEFSQTLGVPHRRVGSADLTIGDFLLQQSAYSFLLLPRKLDKPICPLDRSFQSNDRSVWLAAGGSLLLATDAEEVRKPTALGVHGAEA